MGAQCRAGAAATKRARKVTDGDEWAKLEKSFKNQDRLFCSVKEPVLISCMFTLSYVCSFSGSSELLEVIGILHFS